MNFYPDVLRNPPVPVISLLYLPEYHNQITVTLAQLMESTALRVLSFNDENQLTQKKARRNYDNYKPIGILKRDWMRKHQESIPSVCIILLKWMVTDNVVDWKQMESTVIGTVEKVKLSASGRMTKFMVLVISDKQPPEQQDNYSVEDFLSTIRKTCQLESKSVSVIAEKDLDNVQVFGAKVVRQVSDFSVQYYKDIINRIRKITKGDLKKDTQPQLFARLKFKAGFFMEILKNQPKALKYYTQAYSYITAVSGYDYQVDEIKFVADYMNFKLCLIKLGDRKIENAVKQFTKHMAWFSTQFGDPEILYYHYFLVYRQYRTFGELLEALPKAVLNTQIRHFNPGFYFQAAASSAKQRKVYSIKLCEPQRSILEPKFKEDPTISKPDDLIVREGYIGQYIDQVQVYKAVGLQLDENSKFTAKQRLAMKELLTNHSEEIIKMLSKAYNQYKKLPSLKRLIFFIANSIAEEHFASGQYDKAKQFFDRISKTYRKEKWYDMLTSVLRYSLECSKKLDLPAQCISNQLELISTKLQTYDNEKREFLASLLKYLSSPEDSEISPLDSPLVKDVEPDDVLLSLKVQFEKPSVVVYSTVNFVLQFCCYSPLPLKFSKLQVVFSDTAYSLSVEDEDDLSKHFPSLPPQSIIDLQLQGNGEYTEFKFPLSIRTEQDLQCLAVVLQFGKNPNCSIHFRWKMTDNKYYLSLIKEYDYRFEIGQGFIERPVVRVVQPVPKMKIQFEHLGPILINECYILKVVLHSNEDHVLNGRLNIQVPEGLSCMDFSLETTDRMLFDEIKPNSQKVLVLFITCSTLGAKTVKFKAEFATTTFHDYVLESQLDLNPQYPFDVKYKVFPTRQTLSQDMTQLIPYQAINFFQRVVNGVLGNVAMNERSRVNNNETALTASGSAPPAKQAEGYPVGEPLVFNSFLTLSTPFKLGICSVVLETDQDNFACISEPTIAVEENAIKTEMEHSTPSITHSSPEMATKDSFSLVHLIRPVESGRNLKLGRMIVTCRRKDILNVEEYIPKDIYTTVEPLLKDFSFDYQLPTLNTYLNNVSAFYDLSCVDAKIGKPFVLTLSLQNNTAMVQQVKVFVKDSEAFFFTGSTDVDVSILPYETNQIKYQMIPVVTGNVILPRFEISSLKERVHILTEGESWQIFVSN